MSTFLVLLPKIHSQVSSSNEIRSAGLKTWLIWQSNRTVWMTEWVGHVYMHWPWVISPAPFCWRHGCMAKQKCIVAWRKKPELIAQNEWKLLCLNIGSLVKKIVPKIFGSNGLTFGTNPWIRVVSNVGIQPNMFYNIAINLHSNTLLFSRLVFTQSWKYHGIMNIIAQSRGEFQLYLLFCMKKSYQLYIFTFANGKQFFTCYCPKLRANNYVDFQALLKLYHSNFNRFMLQLNYESANSFYVR